MGPGRVEGWAGLRSGCGDVTPLPGEHALKRLLYPELYPEQSQGNQRRWLAVEQCCRQPVIEPW